MTTLFFTPQVRVDTEAQLDRLVTEWQATVLQVILTD